jgi:hypothetical protein
VSASDALSSFTTNVEVLLKQTQASTPLLMNALIGSATSLVLDNKSGLKAASETLIERAEKLALEQGVDLSDAAASARATAEFTEELVELSNSLLTRGYFPPAFPPPTPPLASDPRALFADFPVAPLSPTSSVAPEALPFAQLSGAVYSGDRAEMLQEVFSLGHNIVVDGYCGDVQYIVTDCVSSGGELRRVVRSPPRRPDPSPPKALTLLRQLFFPRQVTVKGFDATDANINRERLVNEIVRAVPTPLGPVAVHAGFLGMARSLLEELRPHIMEKRAPGRNLVLTGHSIGASIITLVMLLLCEEMGRGWVMENVEVVWGFGAPPFVDERSLEGLQGGGREEMEEGEVGCRTLRAFGLPPTLVRGFVQVSTLRRKRAKRGTEAKRSEQKRDALLRRKNGQDRGARATRAVMSVRLTPLPPLASLTRCRAGTPSRACSAGAIPHTRSSEILAPTASRSTRRALRAYCARFSRPSWQSLRRGPR